MTALCARRLRCRGSRHGPARAHLRARARAFLDSYPAAGYMSKVESWRELPNDEIEFTMRRLKSAD
jgi:hypothetical protein